MPRWVTDRSKSMDGDASGGIASQRSDQPQDWRGKQAKRPNGRL